MKKVSKGNKKMIGSILAVLMCMIFGACAIYWYRYLRVDRSGLKNTKIEVEGNRYQEIISPDVDIESDVVYGSARNYLGEMEELKLDVYTPTKDQTPFERAAIIMLHGGGLTKGDKASEGILKSLSEDLARMGYVVFNVNYRLDSSSSASAQENAMQDAATAFRFIQEQSETYGVDKEHIFFCGYSAGASIAVDVVYSNLTAYSMDRSCVAGVVDIAGVKLHMGRVQENNPACLILHGTEDTTDVYSDSEDLQQVLTKAGVSCILYPLEGINHNVSSQYVTIYQQMSQFFYKELTGQETLINAFNATDPEYEKVLKRIEKNVTYTVENHSIVLDGDLSDWDGCERIALNQLKDAGDALPSPEEFTGEAMMCWKAEEPSILYLAAVITDNKIHNAFSADGKWYNDDCLEIVFDLSGDGTCEQLIKWVCGATGEDYSGLATTENMQVAMKTTGTTTTYELAIDLSKIEDNVLTSPARSTFTVGRCIGFSIAYNDAEDGTRKYQIGWTAGKTSDREVMGNLVFGE